MPHTQASRLSHHPSFVLVMCSHDGKVSKSEFKRAWVNLGGTPSDERIEALFQLIDRFSITVYADALSR